MTRSIPWLLVATQLAAPAALVETAVRRRLPAECGIAAAATLDPLDAERAWNTLYREGHEAIEEGDLETGRQRICAALAHAAGFGPRDWRFAETLDELGLIHFLQADDEASIAAQSLAVAEMLLAEGPRAPGYRAGACASATSYAARLAHPLRRVDRAAEAASIEAAPYRVFTLGLVPVDRALADRLGWLISEYLAVEDMEAARALEVVAEKAGAATPDPE